MSRAGLLLAAGLLMVFGLAVGVLGEDAPPADHLRAFYWNWAEERLEEWEGTLPAGLVPVAAGGKQEAGTGRETVTLEDGVLRVHRDGRLAWETPAHWRVTGFDLAESLRDGRTVLTLSVWREGSFGAGRPFWVEENDTLVRNHFFIHRWDDRFRPIWQSSALDAPNCEYCFADITGDGLLELVTIEGFYLMEGCGWGRFVSVWFWNGWSFVLMDRGPAGHYRDLRVVDSGGKRFILVNEGWVENRGPVIGNR